MGLLDNGQEGYTPPSMPTADALRWIWRMLPPEVRKTYASAPEGLATSLRAAYSIPGKVSEWLDQASTPSQRPGYTAETAPPELRSTYEALTPDPENKWAKLNIPTFVREKVLGLLDMGASTQTGELTPRAIDTFTSAGTLASAGGQPGSLGAGGAPRRQSILRVPQTTRSDLDVPPPGAGHNQPPSAIFDERGRAIQGPAFSKASQEALAKVNAMEPGAGPLNLKGDQRIPGIVQEPIPRYDPPRGVSARMIEALANDQVRKGVLGSIDTGIGMGADKWYHNRALYDAFVAELGPEKGHDEFQKYMDHQSAASPGSDVPTNIRNASYYFVNPDKLPQFAGTENYYPYGHKMQVNHRENSDMVIANEGDWGGYPDIVKKPKPPSYGANLGGNLMPVAGDTHAYRNVAMRTGDPRFLATQFDELSKVNPWAEKIDTSKMTKEEIDKLDATMGRAKRYGELALNKETGLPEMKDGKYKIRYRPQALHEAGRLTMEDAVKMPTMWNSKPTNNEYKALEDFYAELGRERGLTPAEAQSAAWAGAGEFTGLGTPSNRTFGQMHNERVLYTAMMRGEDPKETLRKLIRREAPLLSLPGGGVPPGLLAPRSDEPQQPPMNVEELRRRGLLDSQRVY